MDLLTRKILGWMAGVGGSVIAIVCLLSFGPVRTGGVVCGLITVGLAAFCYWWPKKYLGRPEVGMTWAIGIVGGLATLLYSFLHPIAATALFANVAIVAGAIGYFSAHTLREGKCTQSYCSRGGGTQESTDSTRKSPRSFQARRDTDTLD